MAVFVSLQGLDCSKCTDGQKKYRGCYGAKEGQNFNFKIYGQKYEINRCPVKEITHGSKTALMYYSYYKNGFLPNGKGFSDETMMYCDVMPFIESTLARYEKEEFEIQQRKMKNGSRC